MKEPYLLELPAIGAPDLGYISIAENNNLPFQVQRIYWTYATPAAVVRGNHAHYELEQVVFAVNGNVTLLLENLAGDKSNFLLNNPCVGLFIPKMHWRTINFSADAVLLCLASTAYDESDYIFDFEYFKSLS